MSTFWTLRALTEGDDAVLRAATLLNVNWTGEQRFTAADIETRPDFRHYVELRRTRGDFGLVAEVEGEVAGVVWLVCLGADDPGYGFVADGVPELSITVWAGFRGRGLGRALLTAALAEATARPACASSARR